MNKDIFGKVANKARISRGRLKMGKARYAYFVQVTDTRHKQVSAKEFKELSHHWEAEKEVNGITIYTSAGIECGRRCRKN